MDFVGEDIQLKSVDRIDDVIFVLISNNYATLRELRDDYTIEEVIDLYEICMCNLYNKSKVLKGKKR